MVVFDAFSVGLRCGFVGVVVIGGLFTGVRCVVYDLVFVVGFACSGVYLGICLLVC